MVAAPSLEQMLAPQVVKRLPSYSLCAREVRLYNTLTCRSVFEYVDGKNFSSKLPIFRQ